MQVAFVCCFRQGMAGMSRASPLGRDVGARGALGSETGIPRRLGLLAPKSAIFYRISVEVGQFQGPLEIQKFSGPSTIGAKIISLRNFIFFSN